MDRLDPANLRRFSHKPKFDYLRLEQAWGLLVEPFHRMGGTEDEARKVGTRVKRLANLMPDACPVVAYEHYLSGVRFSAAPMFVRLSAEVAVKLCGKGKVGLL